MTTEISGNYNNYYQNQQQWLQQPYKLQNSGFQNSINFTSNFEQVNQKDSVADGKDDGNIGFWKATGNFIKGIGKFFTGMFTDENGDFSLWQTLKTTAVAVGVGAVCVLTAGTAVPALIASGGVLLAGGSLLKGAYNVATAETDAEAENAWQQVGSGTTATVLSVIGAKAVAKGAHPAEAAAGEFDGISGTTNAVKTVFSDSGEAIVNGYNGIKTAVNGQINITDKCLAVKNKLVGKALDLNNTVRFNYAGHTLNEIPHLIYDDSGAKWMTIYAAGKNSQTTTEARFLSQLPPETRDYYKKLPEAQKQALLKQFKTST